MSYGRAVSKRSIGVNASQLALIHVAKKELGLDDEDYRSILELYGGVSSAKFLTLEGFERVMEHLARLGFQSSNTANRQPKYRPYRDADGAPYPAQLKMIEQQFEQLGFFEAERRQGLCRRIIKKAWPQTRAEANKVFEALKSMIARNYQRQ
ncbi:regulatory protein GemA [Propionispora vibrioides]|uniref:Mu-like prophage protein gp16 n=1 Tax=Propionispora vibrioides TaxID=112903 RepID=A0A1H8U4T6_9FIRM|nr:regulatory protein GemA [Propionispora vibrioides]SEO97843.1 Protein of unknown function [Propionispora vibrioides]